MIPIKKLPQNEKSATYIIVHYWLAEVIWGL